MRVVLDPNVIISGLLSPQGSPGRILAAWQHGGFELMSSPVLLNELRRAMGYPKLKNKIPSGEAEAVLSLLMRRSDIIEDPKDAAPIHSRDSADDYLLALAASQKALLVSGDSHLLDLAADLPIYSPAEFLALLDRDRPAG